MSNQSTVLNQFQQLFTTEAPSLYKNYHKTLGQKPLATAKSLEMVADEIPTMQAFSPFIGEHAEMAYKVYAHFMKTADANEGEEGLQKVHGEFRKLSKELHPDLMFYALKVFATHHPTGHNIQIPSLEERYPHLVFPSRDLSGLKKMKLAKEAKPDEALLNWYREDPLMNEHHEHWHVVYPTNGIPDKYGTPRMKDRHGELFLYMHRQMLARYDTERVILGFERVKPYADFEQPIEEGYDPRIVTATNYMKGYEKREPGLVPRPKVLKRNGVYYFTTESNKNFKRRFDKAVKDRQFRQYQLTPSMIEQIDGLESYDAEAIYQTLVKNGTIKSEGDLFVNKFNPDDKNESVKLPRHYKKYEKKVSDLIRTGYSLWEMDIDLLGKTMETTPGTIDTGTINRNGFFYHGNYHGSGHVLSALIMGEISDGKKPGVMFDEAVAIRDPFFYRWHKVIDDYGYDWEEQMPTEDFSDYPKVQIRKGIDSKGNPWSPDIILVRKEDFPGADNADFNGQDEGEYAFGEKSGNGNFNKDFSKGESVARLGRSGFTKRIKTTDTLNTYMEERTVTYKYKKDEVITSKGKSGSEKIPANCERNENGELICERSETIEYLNHPEFYYFIRAQNQQPFHKKVTIRIFLASEKKVGGEKLSEDRRMWIEMDKFAHELKPMEKAVIFRPAELSSVIKKPAVFDPKGTEIRYDIFDKDEQGRFINSDEYYCDCGWPYSLLLPRGSKEGETFKLMVMITDYEIDRVENNNCCGSMSYCGAKDRYPDSRPMGYPFHRPLEKGQTISDFIASTPNVASRIITIQEIEPPK